MILKINKKEITNLLEENAFDKYGKYGLAAAGAGLAGYEIADHLPSEETINNLRHSLAQKIDVPQPKPVPTWSNIGNQVEQNLSHKYDEIKHGISDTYDKIDKDYFHGFLPGGK